MKRTYSLVLFLLVSSLVFAQSPKMLTVKGRIIDADTQKPMENVNIYNLQNFKGAVSSAKGRFKIKIDSLPSQVQFSFIGYETQAVWITEEGDKWLDIQLHPYLTTLPDVVVSAQPKIEEITKKEYTVRDFVFYKEDILIMTFPGMKDGNYLVLIDIEGNAKDSLSLKGIKRFDFLTKSCLGHIHLVTDTHDYQIEIGEKGGRIVGKEDRKVYSRIVEPCIAATDRYLFYQFRFCLGQLLKFEGFDRESDYQFTLGEVANGENLERRYWEELAPHVGYIDGLNISWEEKQNELQRVLQRKMELAGLVHLFYQPVYAPMLNLGTQLCVFNHPANVLELYDTNGTFQRKVPINYHHIKKWDKRIMLDEFTGKVYTTFDHPKGKLIREVDTENGMLGVPTLIDCVYIDKMKIRKGVLYYLESGASVSAANRVLHKVRL